MTNMSTLKGARAQIKNEGEITNLQTSESSVRHVIIGRLGQIEDLYRMWATLDVDDLGPLRAQVVHKRSGVDCGGHDDDLWVGDVGGGR